MIMLSIREYYNQYFSSPLATFLLLPPQSTLGEFEGVEEQPEGPK